MVSMVSLTKKGKSFFPIKYSQIAEVWSKGLYKAGIEKVALYNLDGQPITTSNFDALGNYSNGLIAAKMDDKWGFIDLSGKIVITYKYDEVKSFSKNRALVKLNRKWGLIDKEEHLILPIAYEKLISLSNQFYKAKQGNKWGLVNRNGELILPFEYEKWETLTTTTFLVKKNNKYGIINSSGEIVVPINNNVIRKPLFASNQQIKIRQKHLWGIIDHLGNEIIPQNYQEIELLENNYFQVKQIDNWGGSK